MPATGGTNLPERCFTSEDLSDHPAGDPGAQITMGQ